MKNFLTICGLILCGCLWAKHAEADSGSDTTNFYTAGTCYLGGGAGLIASDTNTGTYMAPWASVSHANINTPAGFTLAVAPGEFLSTLTNMSVNYQLFSGTTISLANYWGSGMANRDISFAGTNLVNNNGDLNGNLISPALVLSTNSYIKINCDQFGDAEPEADVHEFASNASFTLFCNSTSNLNIYQDGTAAQGTASKVEVHADIAQISAISLGGGNGSLLPTLRLYFNTAYLSDSSGNGGYLLDSSSIFSGNQLWISGTANFNASLGVSSQNFTWAVKETFCDGNQMQFPTNMTFIGLPYFDTNSVMIGSVVYNGHGIITPTNANGSFQVP